MTGSWWTVTKDCGCKYDEYRAKGRRRTYKVARHFKKRCKAHPKPRGRET